MKWGVLRVDAVFFDVSRESCQEKLQERRKGQEGELGHQIVEEDEELRANIAKPEHREGFGEIHVVKNQEESRQVMKLFTKKHWSLLRSQHSCEQTNLK